MHDILDGHTELRRHLLAEIDRDPRITAGLGFGGPEPTAGRADRDRHPQLAGRGDFVLQGISTCKTCHHHRDTQNEAGDQPRKLNRYRSNGHQRYRRWNFGEYHYSPVATGANPSRLACHARWYSMIRAVSSATCWPSMLASRYSVVSMQSETPPPVTSLPQINAAACRAGGLFWHSWRTQFGCAAGTSISRGRMIAANITSKHSPPNACSMVTKPPCS